MTEENLKVLRNCVKELSMSLCNLMFTLDDILKSNEKEKQNESNISNQYARAV